MKNFDLINSYLDKLNTEKKITLFKDTPLADFSTFKIGGNATFIVLPENIETLVEILSKLQELKERFLVFGNASNVLFCDEGIDGVVIFTSHLKNIYEQDGYIYCDAGVNLSTLSKFTYNCGYTGCEFACGIPGAVGGAIYMNAGAYDGSMSNILDSVIYYDILLKKVITKSIDELSFEYRSSEFQSSKNIVLSAKFKFEKTDNPKLVDKQMKAYLKSRAEKQPLEYPSAGSTFKRYPGYYTSKLIDEAGLKGESFGGAQVSCKHAGFIINTGNASAKDVMGLIRLVQDRIYAIYGIHIETEVIYIE